ncbi:hypothetical protein BDV32DRAFT_120762 [Aspergillus pseudonomiae]|uniref:Uncharacterized protein n=1 Tax=Aspergillus pseudonomiae TaxID=1506151 RepID=A0A5N7D0I0_9EURO|nr:uncharacterized protein BDV37DRAFT_259151 [Aspergillus pseudonomiae]KAB8261917.1 hypothetical protein BDV32DRAFT_120762 [Aspergillus pseudonomiae]KAE8399922.1 hypothetical protein BDV37DRAFT_259151 [Aspergillus pseudonomiae]
MSTTTFFTLPFLALVSIPLVISAYITICFSVLALFLRLSVIYIELCYAIIASYFVIPTSNTSSLLNFAPSEPTTPLAATTPKRRSLDYGRTIHFSDPSCHQSNPVSPSHSRPGRGQRRNSSHLEEPNDQDSTLHDIDGRRIRRAEHHKNGYYPSLRGFLGLISGDERRDFEGVGGWRCWTSSSKVYGLHSRSVSSSSSNSVSEEADERAWLSINNRLELPSQPLGMRNNELSEHSLPWRHRQMLASPDDSHGLHHRRSATTSVLSSLNIRTPNSLSLALSIRSDNPAFESRSRAVSPHSQSRQSIGDIPSVMLSSSQTNNYVVSPADGSGGYFSLRPSSGVSSRTTTPGSTTPIEENRSPRAMGRAMAHYPGGVRYRRRSISGPNSSARIVRSS